MIKQLISYGMIIWLTVGLSACSDFDRAIGKGKSAPDEFQVVVRPPLSLPPGFADKPADIVRKANQSGSSSENQVEKLLETGNAEKSEFTDLFDFTGVTDDIRNKIDEETYGIKLEKRLPIEILFGDVPDVGLVLDKMAEDFRLRKARLEGQAPTDGSTKAIDPTNNQPLNIN